jgi:hypothetical protein
MHKKKKCWRIEDILNRAFLFIDVPLQKHIMVIRLGTFSKRWIAPALELSYHLR